ncbi:GNAT family N-acetyltransferase [Paraburkholderia saeva]|uniref:N-acetyltransferase domain-containing protein n=1 Tax=Paraburkholderia saeva TaxID=2777537 RepID=A0A9N8S0R8_9BURK|nr:GNAT family N-acetyltransferase [Paraburkholderia saeva]CAG4914891.1 hypothetical protein LMG31841_04421 [Paraburkholderia saeva]
MVAIVPPVAIQTNRIDLHPIAAADVRALATLMCEPAVLVWMPAMGVSLSIDAAVTMFETSVSNAESHGAFDLVAVRRNDSALMGQVTIPSPGGKLEFWLGLPFWGYGYATEMVNAALQLLAAHDAADLLTARVHRDNLASRKVLEKTGFRLTGEAWCRFDSYKNPLPILDYSL